MTKRILSYKTILPNYIKRRDEAVTFGIGAVVNDIMLIFQAALFIAIFRLLYIYLKQQHANFTSQFPVFPRPVCTKSGSHEAFKKFKRLP